MDLKGIWDFKEIELLLELSDGLLFFYQLGLKCRHLLPTSSKLNMNMSPLFCILCLSLLKSPEELFSDFGPSFSGLSLSSNE